MNQTYALFFTTKLIGHFNTPWGLSGPDFSEQGFSRKIRNTDHNINQEPNAGGDS